MAKVVHFEIPVDDPDRAVEFYRRTLGWRVSRYGDAPYWLVQAGEEGEQGADGALVAREELHRTPVLVAGVGDLDDVVRRVLEAGGGLLQERMPVPGVGWSAYVTDSEGNTVGLFQPDPAAARQVT